MKILFVLGAYKPHASANGLCSSNVIEFLKKQGHSVTVLCNQSIGCEAYEYGAEGSVYRLKPRFYVRLREYAELLANRAPRKGRALLCIAKILNKIQLAATVPFWPIVSRSTAKRFEKMAKKLHRKHNYDVVIAVYTPIDALLAGYAIKKENPHVKFIPYFLDSLSGGYGPKIFSKERIVKRGLRIEKKVYPVSDTIVLMKSSEEHQRTYNPAYLDKMTFLDIPMLVRPEMAHSQYEAAGEKNRYRLLFVGSISRNIRNPKTLIDALLCIDREDIICEFIGNIDCTEDFSLLKERMGERLIFSAFMDHDKLLEKLASAHILINIGNQISTMVPSKIFEYMSYLKPIISTYDIEDEPSVEYLRRYPAARLLSGRSLAEDNAALILDLIQNLESTQVDFDALEKQFYLNTPKAFGDTLDRLLRSE